MGNKSFSCGMQKKGENIRTPASEGISQVSGGTQGYPATNGSESLSYDKCSSSQKPKFALTAEAPLTSKPWQSGKSNTNDYKGGSHKNHGGEKAGPDIRSGKPGASYV